MFRFLPSCVVIVTGAAVLAFLQLRLASSARDLGPARLQDAEDAGSSATTARGLPLSLCPPKKPGSERSLPSADSNLLLVSTLDGRITALDPRSSGRVVWAMGTEPGAMLSSTISKTEFANNARWVRLIPSLGGGLYKFDGEVVEPVPVDAESLLKSSFRFATDAVMTGGKESRTYGVDLATGAVRYECSLSGCSRGSEPLDGGLEDDDQDVIVIRRETQIVRAVDPRSGDEKWNFSVSQHNVELHAGLHKLCQEEEEDEEGSKNPFLDESDGYKDGGAEIKAVVSDGIICSVDRSRPDRILWKKQFETPIVHAWRVVDGKLFKVNLFSSSHLPEREDGGGGSAGSSPVLYLGSFNNQLYIQESEREGEGAPTLQAVASYPRVTWKPYLISADSRTPIINHGSDAGTNIHLPLLTYDPSDAKRTALTVFHHPGIGYPYDAGLYLFPDPQRVEVEFADVTTVERNDAALDGNATDVKVGGPVIYVVFVSIWHWWKEILFTSFVTAIFMNLLVTRPLLEDLKNMYKRRRTREVMIVQVPYEVQVEVPVPRTPDTGSLGTNSSEYLSQMAGDQPYNFVSRFVHDYEPVSCLGAGGFGVVFESKNRLDDVHYAVKRVKLPASEKAKGKVLREVKFLAKLDHRHIVRYFTTWLEYPPAGWQEERDAWWRRGFGCSGGGGGGGSTEQLPQTDTDFPISELQSENNELFANTFSKDDSLVIDFEDEDEYDGLHNPKSVISVDESSAGIAFGAEDDDAANVCDSTHDLIPRDSNRTGAKFWRDSASSSSEDGSAVCDALQWDERNRDLNKNEVEKDAPHVYLYIVMQLCQRQSLKCWLKASERNRAKSLQLFRQICLGVEYVHSQGLIHRDLKPSNIFFSNDGTAKIGDFGLVTEHCFDDGDSELPVDGGGGGDGLLNQHTEEVGTVSYMSPEQLGKKHYDHKVDVYSLGLVLFEMLVPFSTQMERAVAMSDVRRLKFPQHFLTAPEHQLVRSMLSRDPNERPEASEILEMEFLQEDFPEPAAAAAAQRRRSRRQTSSSATSSETSLPSSV